MDRKPSNRRLAAILAADVVGYSRMMAADEDGTLDALRRHREQVFDPCVAEHGGRIFKLMGDGTLVEFPSVVDAVKCALEIQRRQASDGEAQADRRITLRIGINLGDIIIEGDDVYGDGVNVAARLEPLAEPGGVCVASIVRESLGERVGIAFRDAGEVSVKNIDRPIRIWTWHPDATADAESSPSAPAKASQSVGTGIPSIVVLPFVSMSEDPEQEFFADGISEDITTELSRFPDLFVIGRNSAFAFKGRDLKAQQIGAELGVGYVISGSVRRGGDRIRVTVQMVDATSGKQIHAERFDRAMGDIFELQDDLTSSIVGSLPGHVRSAEAERVRRIPTRDLEAYECLLAGRECHHLVTADDNVKALELLDRAIELDPECASAWAWKACVIGQSLMFGYADDVQAGLKQAMEALHRALQLDEDDVECHRLFAEFYMYFHKLDQAAPHAERAIALNPNDPRIVAQQGELLTWLGKPDEAVGWIEKASRLDPYGAPGRAHLLGRALYGVRRYEEAARAYRGKSRPSCGHRAELAASLAQSGRQDEAETVARDMLDECSDFSADRHVASLPYHDADREHMRAGLAKAGL